MEFMESVKELSNMVYYQIDLDLLLDKPVWNLSRENAWKVLNIVPGTIQVLT